ncbi:MAG: hypothetical protein II928_05005 [Paludibacteraceae bacterium]|nr:hypothetical protein [Paludibacteraceae bacterium]
MMKRFLTFVMALALVGQVNAFVVKVNDEEIPAEGKEITVTESEYDIFTEKTRMGVAGYIYSPAGSLAVTITRSETGLEDEFCCGSQCTSGNQQMNETKNFTVGDAATWYVHYFPAQAGNVTMTYTFSDSTESRTLTVHFNYTAEGIEEVQETQEGAIYDLSGRRTEQVSAGSVYIQNGKKKVTTY